MMSIYWLFLYVPCILLLIFTSYKTAKRNMKLFNVNQKLMIKNGQLLDYINVMQNTMLGRAEPAPKATKGRIIDDTTAKLIRLTVNNPSSNEAANAAMAACARLSKKLK